MCIKNFFLTLIIYSIDIGIHECACMRQHVWGAAAAAQAETCRKEGGSDLWDRYCLDTYIYIYMQAWLEIATKKAAAFVVLLLAEEVSPTNLNIWASVFCEDAPSISLCKTKINYK